MSSIVLGVSGAMADNIKTPVLPNAVRSECTSCHIAYPPGLMTRKNWESIMSNLSKHYGTDASVSEADLNLIAPFFLGNASTREKHTSLSTPPRITTSAWFQKEHQKIPVGVWANPKVGTKANCTACHTQAEKGSFTEHQIIVPGYEGRKW